MLALQEVEIIRVPDHFVIFLLQGALAFVLKKINRGSEDLLSGGIEPGPGFFQWMEKCHERSCGAPSRRQGKSGCACALTGVTDLNAGSEAGPCNGGSSAGHC